MADLLVSTLMSHYPADAALALESQDSIEVAELLNTYPERISANVLAFLSAPKQAECVRGLTDLKLLALLPHLPISSSSQLLLHITRERRKKLLPLLPLPMTLALKVLHRFPEGTAGAAMDPLTPTLPLGVTVEEALKRLRTLTQVVPHQVFIVDENRLLLGRVSTSVLLLAPRKSHIDDWLDIKSPVFSAHSRLEDYEQHPAWINETLVPVVDSKGLFLGGLSQSALMAGLHPLNEPSNSTVADRHNSGWVGMADLLWASLGSLLTPSKKDSKPPAGNSHEH
jgi:magnesium transporter